MIIFVHFYFPFSVHCYIIIYNDKMYRENLFNQGKLKYNSKNADDNPECMNAVIIKNRHGDRGTCALRWHGRYSRVSDF